ncbi:MAG TPA: DUF192 domain-containing protein [Kofleriaceae bacterium]|nr:DUF192 domain-containing protein [Kofleriaceae bacterium]
MTAQAVLIPMAAAALAMGACGRQSSDERPRAGAGSAASGAAADTAGRAASGGDDVNDPAGEGAATEAAAEVVFRPRGGAEARVAVEVARTRRQIQLGLMYRTHMPPDAGMLFLFARPGVQRFWMKNTLIPLDMIFVTSEMVVGGVVANAEPKTLTSRTVPGVESQYVVEVNAGWAVAHGVAAGVPVDFVRVTPLAPGEGDFE